jgi:hypothetical protein
VIEEIRAASNRIWRAQPAMQNLTPALNFFACGEVAAAHHDVLDDRGPTLADGLLAQGVRGEEYANSDKPMMSSGDWALLALLNFAERYP